MPRAVLVALLWAFLAQACHARGYYEDGSNRELSEVQKMKGVEVRISEVQYAADLPLSMLGEGPRIPVTPLVQFTFEFLPENDFLGQGPLKKFVDKSRSRAFMLLQVVLCTRDRDKRIVSVASLSIYRDLRDETRPSYMAVQFAISKEMVENSFLRFVEMTYGPRQATDLYLGQKPDRSALESAPTSESKPTVRASGEAFMPDGSLPLIPGLPPPPIK